MERSGLAVVTPDIADSSDNDPLLSPDFSKEVSAVTASGAYAVVRIPDPMHFDELRHQIDAPAGALLVMAGKGQLKRRELVDHLKGIDPARVAIAIVAQ